MHYDEPSERIILGNELNPPRCREGQYPKQNEILVFPADETNPPDERTPRKPPFALLRPSSDE